MEKRKKSLKVIIHKSKKQKANLAIFFFLSILFWLFGCKRNENAQKYVFSSSQILVSSDREDKEQLLNECKEAKVYLSEASTLIEAECLFGEKIKSEFSKIEYVDSLSLASSYSLLTSRYFFNSDRKYKKISLLDVKEDVIDSLYIIVYDKNRILLIYEPYVIEFKKINIAKAY